MEEERVKKGAKGKPSTSLSYSGSESEADEMKMAVDSRNEDKSSTAENTAKTDGQEVIEEDEEEEEEEEESDEEEEDDEEEEEESDDDDDGDDIGVINKKNRKKIAILESESSDDGEGDDCPICLNRLKYQDIGTPEACDHNFCLDCIQLWARNVNTCPVDRREFQLILARHAKENEIFKRIPVSGKSCQDEDDDTDVNEDFTYCELCGQSDREDRLLLCDGCDLGYHCECLDPPLDSVPVEEWFCPCCAEANTQRSGRMLNDLDDMQYLLEENSLDGIPYLRPRRRQIARTRISERVRARIQEYREGLARLVCDDEEPEASDEEGEGPSTRLSRTRSQTRQSEAKRKQSSRKKTKKGTKGKQKSYPKKKLRRRTKTSAKAQIFDRLRTASKSKSTKSRLAGKLGLTKPRVSLRKSDRATASQILKEDLYGAKPLSIMGRKHDLDPFPDDDSHSRSEEPQASTSVFSAAAAKRASKYSASALLSRQPVARPLLCKLPEDNPTSNFFSSHCSNSGASSAASNSGGDLLGSIMMDQNLLHLESKDVKINRDGSLTAKKDITASAVKELKTKEYTTSLFFDSKEDENSSVHMDSENEENFESSKVTVSTGCHLSARNNSNNNNEDEDVTASRVDCEKKENSEQIEESMESDTDIKYSDTEARDSDSETKPSTFESVNEMSAPANQDDDDDDVDDDDDDNVSDDDNDQDEEQAEEKEEKNDSENAEDSFENNEADKSVETVNMEQNEDSCSRDGAADDGLQNETSENVSPEKEDADKSGAEEEVEDNIEEEEEEEEEKEKEEEEEEEENKVTYKDEQKDDNLAEHVEEEEEQQQEEEEEQQQEEEEEEQQQEEEEEEEEEQQQEEEEEEEEQQQEEEEAAASEQGSCSFSPAPYGSPGDKNRDVEPNSDAEDASFAKAEDEEFVSDEENVEKDTSTYVEKLDDSAEVSEGVQEEQQTASDAEDTEEEDDTEKEDEDSVKSGAEEVNKDVDETSPKSDVEDRDTEMVARSDVEDLDTEEPVDETSAFAKSDGEENDVKETEEEETEVGEDVKYLPEEDDDDNCPDLEAMQDNMLPSEFERTEEQEYVKAEDSDDNGENLASENMVDQIEEEKDSKLEVADEASENFDDAASEEMVKAHNEELETFEGQNEVVDEEVTPVSGSESEMSSLANENEEMEDEEEEKPKIPISELPRIPKRNRRDGYRREKSSRGDGPELKSVLGRVDMPEYKMGRPWDKKDSRRSRWDPDEWSQAERDIDCTSNRDRKSEAGKSYHSDRSESSRESEKYSFEYKESKSRKRRRERSRSRSRCRKDSAVEYRDIPHRRHSPERSKSRRRDRSRNRSRSGSREKSFDYEKSHKRKSRGRSRDRSQSRKSRRHRSYSRSPSRKRDKERGSTDKRRHREERKRGEERSHKRHSERSDPEESRKKRQVHEEYEEWDDGSCQVVDFDESTSPKGTTAKKPAECFYGSHSSNEKVNENFFNRRIPPEKGTFKGDKIEESGSFYNARSSSKKHKFVDRFYKAPHMRTVGTEKFPIHLSEDESEDITAPSKASRLEDSEKDKDTTEQDSGDSEYDPAFPTESGSPPRGQVTEEAPIPSEEPAAPVVVAVTAAASAVTTTAVVVSSSLSTAADEITSSGPIDETPHAGSQGILGDSSFMVAENPNLQNIPMQPQNITFPMGIRMMPPGMQPGIPQHLLMNPMFLNRPPPFNRLPRISGPVGRLGWSMNPSGIMQIPPNRFGPARMGPGGAMPPRPGLLNGGFEGMPQEHGQPMPPFKQHPCDPRNIPSHTAGSQGPTGQIPRPGLTGHPPPHMPHIPPPGPLLPHPQQHPPPPPPSSQQMHIPPPTSDTLSSSSLDSQTAPLHLQHGLGKSQPSSDDKSASSNFSVPELNQITKLIEAHKQALQNKQRNTSSSLQGGDIDVFKIPLPPMAPPSVPPPTMGLPIVPPPETHNYTSATKSYKNRESKLLANSHSSSELASESTEVVDMDVASPLDDEVAIELPASPELDDIDESKINMKDSSVIELTVPEDMPASAVELTNLTNKEKHTSRVKKSNPKASQQRTASPTSTKTSYMGYMKKLQIQERVVDEVKLAIKPFYSGKKIDKNEYKEILRKAVPKICHSKSGNINPAKIKALIEAYVDKMCKTRKYMERKKKLSLKANGERIKKPSR